MWRTKANKTKAKETEMENNGKTGCLRVLQAQY
jgi:hypothetical protein